MKIISQVLDYVKKLRIYQWPMFVVNIKKTLLRTRPDGISIFHGFCQGFALDVQYFSWSNNAINIFQIYVKKYNFLGRTSTESKYDIFFL